MLVKFQNKGLITLDLIRVMGINAKETKNPIGQFGTGLKYAIATILRTGGKITLYRGKVRYAFAIKQRTVRKQKVRFITMNGEELPYTVDLGKNWKAWQAFRELHTNATDELDPEIGTVEHTFKGLPGRTCFVVEHSEFLDLLGGKDSVFLPEDKTLIATLPSCTIYEGSSSCIYYRGMRALDIQPESRFTYNWTDHLALTEDRTVMYSFYITDRLTHEVLESDNRYLIGELLTESKNRDLWESRLNFESVPPRKVSDGAFSVIADLRKEGTIINGSVRKVYDAAVGARSVSTLEYSRTLTEPELRIAQEAFGMLQARLPNLPALPFHTINDTGMVSISGSSWRIGNEAILKGTQSLAIDMLMAAATEYGGGDRSSWLASAIVNRACGLPNELETPF